MSEIAKHWIDGEWAGSDTVQEALAYAKPVVRGGPATDGDLAAGAFYRRPCSRSRTSTPTSCRRRSSAR